MSDTTRMRHPDPNASFGEFQRDETGGFMIPNDQVEQAQSHGFLVAHDDAQFEAQLQAAGDESGPAETTDAAAADGSSIDTSTDQGAGVGAAPSASGNPYDGVGNDPDANAIGGERDIATRDAGSSAGEPASPPSGSGNPFDGVGNDPDSKIVGSEHDVATRDAEGNAGTPESPEAEDSADESNDGAAPRRRRPKG